MVFPPSRSFPSYQAASDALTYEPFFGLTEKPFSLNADLRFLFDSPSHEASLKALLDGIRRREGFVVLTGEIGTGKTMLCRAALRRLGKKTFSSFVPDPFSSREDLLKTLLIDFGVISIGDLTSGTLKGLSRTELSYLLSGFLDSIAPLDTYVVVIIDEAQNLAAPMIEETRILGDSFGGSARLQIVFVGQMELHERLKAPEMRQVDQRITSYTRLAPLTLESIGGYVRHRLLVAGYSGNRELFPQDVLELVHRRSGGVPRLINRICDGAMAAAFERQAVVIDHACVDAALKAIGATTFTPTWVSIVADSSPNAAPAMPLELFGHEAVSAAPFDGEAAIAPAPDNVAPFPTLPVEAETAAEDDFLAQLDAEWAARQAEEDESSRLKEGVTAIDLDAFDTATEPSVAAAASEHEDRLPSFANETRVFEATAAHDPIATPSQETLQNELVPAIFERNADPAPDSEAVPPQAAAELPGLNAVAPAASRRTPEAGRLFRGSWQVAPAPEAFWQRRVGVVIAAVAAAAIVVFGVLQMRSYFGPSTPPVEAVGAPVVAPPASPAPTTTPAAAPPADATPAAVTPPAAAPEYYVAVGLYLSEAYANTVIDKLTAAVFPAKRRSVNIRGQAYEQVVVGPFKTREDATTALERLRELSGYDDSRVIALTPPSVS